MYTGRDFLKFSGVLGALNRPKFMVVLFFRKKCIFIFIYLSVFFSPLPLFLPFVFIFFLELAALP